MAYSLREIAAGQSAEVTEAATDRSPSIDEPLAKLNHGRQHLDKLEAAVTTYIEDPASFSFEFIPHPNGELITRLRRVVDPPTHLALTYGDAIHNIRASLDYLVRQLGIADSHKVSDKSEFPVVLDAGMDEQK